MTGSKATEAAFRLNAPGRSILHVACHGLVDQTYGNFFGALALTRGPQPTPPPPAQQQRAPQPPAQSPQPGQPAKKDDAQKDRFTLIELE